MQNPSRRRVLAAGFAGTVLGAIGGRTASATTPPSEAPGSAPPERPTGDDVELLAFAHTVELTARDLYQAAIDAGLDSTVFTAMRDQHQAFADVLSGLLGTRASTGRDDAVHEQAVGSFEQGDETVALEAAYELESTAVATHTELLRSLAGIDGAQAVASILVIEARHCTVLADASGRGDDLDALFVNDAEPLAPGQSTGG